MANLGTVLFSIIVLQFVIRTTAAGNNFHKTVDINFGDGRAKILEGGRALSLSMDKYSGSGFQSKKEFLYGRFDIQIKLVPGNSAGSVTTFFLSSQGNAHDEIDFEFLGNASGEPYTVHTNVYAEGKGGREQQFRLWFNPTAAFHTYSIVWNTQRIIFLVDNIPIRVYNNNEAVGVPFPKNQPMRVYCSLWNADDWATQGGLVKADWSKAPFVANYRNFNINACVTSSSQSSSVGACGSNTAKESFSTQAWKTQELDAAGRNRLRWVQRTHMIYNYCTDRPRFPQGLPAECRRSRF